MERTRRVVQGRLSEILGEKTVGIDTFHRTVGLHRVSVEAVKNMNARSLALLQAYSDGVNEFIFNRKKTTILSPELILLGVTQPEPWAPVHTIGIMKLLTFHLSWNWAQDLFREVLLISELEDLV